MDEAHPGKLVKVAGWAGEHEAGGNGDGLPTPTRALSVYEASQVWATRITVHESPQGALVEAPQAVAGSAAEPLREGDRRNSDPCCLTATVGSVLLQDGRLAQLFDLATQHPPDP